MGNQQIKTIKDDLHETKIVKRKRRNIQVGSSAIHILLRSLLVLLFKRKGIKNIFQTVFKNSKFNWKKSVNQNIELLSTNTSF